jgi:hypothetical protein
MAKETRDRAHNDRVALAGAEMRHRSPSHAMNPEKIRFDQPTSFVG